jgi:ribosomal-protein-alanine N-acetyltransferase
LREPDAKPQNVQPGRIEIRDASAIHAPLLAALHSQCFERGWNAEVMAGIVAMPGAVALLALSEKGEPLGFVIARCAADEAEILTMGVVPSRRRCSVAEKLLGEVAGRLSGRGARNLHIEVAESNSAALGLYEKIGFMRSGRRRDYYAAQGGLREDAVTMTRPLPIAPHHV